MSFFKHPAISERCCWQQFDEDHAGNISNEKYKCCDYHKDGARTCYTWDSPIERGPAGSGSIPTNVAPPKLCPDGSTPDANGKCPPVTQGGSNSGSNSKKKGDSGKNKESAGLSVSDEGAPGKKPVKK
jgi:hypothetical protein